MQVRAREQLIANGIFRRFGRFSVVGAGGILVQTATLAMLLRFSGIHYMLATALAVELSVLHNFAWHRRWTWADRPATRAALVLLRFNATNGVMSLAGNLFFMWLLVGGLGLEPHAANLITIGLCSLVNFALADRFVFV
ncbi:MAG TPA: GtrA family protein [Blastocatellia bacterium]|nr:GtrA family protein [Blastocatellia bacterium]